MGGQLPVRLSLTARNAAEPQASLLSRNMATADEGQSVGKGELTKRMHLGSLLVWIARIRVNPRQTLV
jgi:hypothetical protein